MPRIWHRAVMLLGVVAVLSGCAAQADRTRALLELDLADRGRAIGRLEAEFQREPAAWRAYSLGVLHGADGDYPAMHDWFDRCSDLTDLYDQKIIRIVGEHWRDEARRADEAMTEGRWPAAVEACEQALLADPGRDETRLRLVEARVMAWGPELEEIRRLVATDRTAVLETWLAGMVPIETPQDTTTAVRAATVSAARRRAETRLAVRVRLQAQLAGARAASSGPGDAYAAYIVGELARLDGDWVAMDQSYRQAETLATATQQTGVVSAIDHATRIAARRRVVADDFLTRALTAWGDLRVSQALACLDTAELADPGRADVVKTRGNIELLAGAANTQAVRTALSLGDLDADWLALWMIQLYNRGRHADAALVADALLGTGSAQSKRGSAHGTVATDQRVQQHALSLRADYRLETGDLAGAAVDLRDLIRAGRRDAHTAVVLGDVLASLSAYAEARHWYAQAATWGDDSAELDARRARVAFSQGRLDEMLLFGERALAAAPDNDDYRRLVQRAQVLTGEVRP